MTVEKRTLISPKDILGIECECIHCHARLLVAIKKIDNFPVMCPNCGKRWMSEQQPSSSEVSESVILRHLITYLDDLQRTKVGQSIRFEIASEVHSAHDANAKGQTPQ